jgi:hypothetical protein
LQSNLEISQSFRTHWTLFSYRRSNRTPPLRSTTGRGRGSRSLEVTRLPRILAQDRVDPSSFYYFIIFRFMYCYGKCLNGLVHSPLRLSTYTCNSIQRNCSYLGESCVSSTTVCEPCLDRVLSCFWNLYPNTSHSRLWLPLSFLSPSPVSISFCPAVKIKNL